MATMLKTPVEETKMRSLGGNLETFHARLQCADGMIFQHELASIRTKAIAQIVLIRKSSDSERMTASDMVSSSPRS